MIYLIFNTNQNIDNKPMNLSNTGSKDFDDDLGFDVDELVKKIDAKIAELEAEEKRQNEATENGSSLISENNGIDKSVDSPISKDDKMSDESKNIEKSEENIEENKPKNSIESIYNTSTEVPEKTKPMPNINLDEDGDDDDDFFDDFFDN